MKITIELTEKEIEKLDDLTGEIFDYEYDEDIIDAIHKLIEIA
jgi:hypothetical protein